MGRIVRRCEVTQMKTREIEEIDPQMIKIDAD